MYLSSGALYSSSLWPPRTPKRAPPPPPSHPSRPTPLPPEAGRWEGCLKPLSSLAAVVAAASTPLAACLASRFLGHTSACAKWEPRQLTHLATTCAHALPLPDEHLSTEHLCCQFISPATCGPKGHGSTGIALQIYPFPVPDGLSVIIGLPCHPPQKPPKKQNSLRKERNIGQA